jgi:hypothetical protein
MVGKIGGENFRRQAVVKSTMSALSRMAHGGSSLRQPQETVEDQRVTL